MPELPEVEISCRGIRTYLVGKVILYTIVRTNELRLPISKEIYTIKNELVFNVKRRAKYLLLELQNGCIIIHLGMSGCLRVTTQKLLPDKHDHIDLIFDNGKILRYTDPRRLGIFLWSQKSKMPNMFKYLGPEPLSKMFSTNYLKTKCTNKRIVIKSLLMDNRLVVGIGNIYANESLFVAKINPIRPSYSLSMKESEVLVQSIKSVLKSAIKYGGTSLLNFLQIDGNPGLFRHKLQVYGRTNEPCLVCDTPIIRIKHRQRATFYCCKCQK